VAWKSVTQKKQLFEYAKVLKHGINMAYLKVSHKPMCFSRPFESHITSTHINTHHIQSTPENRLQEGSNLPASYHSPTSHRSAPGVSTVNQAPQHGTAMKGFF